MASLVFISALVFSSAVLPAFGKDAMRKASLVNDVVENVSVSVASNGESALKKLFIRPMDVIQNEVLVVGDGGEISEPIRSNMRADQASTPKMKEQEEELATAAFYSEPFRSNMRAVQALTPKMKEQEEELEGAAFYSEPIDSNMRADQASKPKMQEQEEELEGASFYGKPIHSNIGADQALTPKRKEQEEELEGAAFYSEPIHSNMRADQASTPKMKEQKEELKGAAFYSEPIRSNKRADQASTTEMKEQKKERHLPDLVQTTREKKTRKRHWQGKSTRARVLEKAGASMAKAVLTCCLGDTVKAKWAGEDYDAKIAKVNEDSTYTVNWDDGGTTGQVVTPSNVKCHKASYRNGICLSGFETCRGMGAHFTAIDDKEGCADVATQLHLGGKKWTIADVETWTGTEVGLAYPHGCIYANNGKLLLHTSKNVQEEGDCTDGEKADGHVYQCICRMVGVHLDQ